MNTEATPEQRDAVMDPWKALTARDGWDDVDLDPLYWAAVDGLAWNLLEQTSDVADRTPSAESLASARATAERILATRSLVVSRPEAEELAHLLAEHEVVMLGPLGPVRCRACDDWTEGTIWEHRVAVLLAADTEAGDGR